MWEFFKTYLVAFGVFLVVEGLWLSVVAKDFYQKEIGFLMSESPKIIPTVIFAVIFIAGVVFFVVNPALVKDSWKYAVLAGLLFGLVAYATYDLTALATFKDWPLKVTVVDLLWGSSMSAIVSYLTFVIIKILS